MYQYIYMCDTQKKIVFNIVLYFISFLIFMTVDMHLKDIKIGNKFQKTQLDHDCVMHVFN
jgi:hypothetical protein